MRITLSKLAERLGAKLLGEDLSVSGISSLDRATESDLSFVESRAYLEAARNSRAKALIVSSEIAEELADTKSLLITENVRAAFAKAAWLFYQEPEPPKGVSPLAFVEEGVEIGEGVSVYPFVYLGRGAKIGRGAVLYPGVFVGEGAEIGENVKIYPNAVIYPRARIGPGVIIHAGTVIGADGFGYAQEWTGEGLKHLKIPHFGTVEIGEEVEIGANACVDRATFGVTRIGAGTKIDNLTQIGHNVEIGEGAIIVAQCGLSGHARVGRFVMMGGQVGLAPGAQIGEGAKIAAKSGVSGKIAPGEEVAGIPAIPVRVWRKAVVAFAKLPDMVKELRKLKALLGGKK